MAKPDKINLPISKDLLEKLLKIQEIELEDVDIELEEIEFDISGGGGGGMPPALMYGLAREFSTIRDSANKISYYLGGGIAPQVVQQPAQPTAFQ